ncbi:17-beta-hydroxysteroid dehydrogenase type 6-like [Styela clava]|uniref:17-beta-hydroxysteroid dehydrogenase type 6-like n=1 Tax=Styela clava TaxID=7725 RepID=UPI001939E021|nr:17-beta-hydroxysteroid dehydrogenase type 6-like [Styela clava]
MAKLQKTVVITGCDTRSSYAYELALRLDEQGYTVFAGCTDCNSVGARSLASRGSTALAILQIDVTKPNEINNAVEMIEDSVGEEGVWALVNCAEVFSVAEVDWCPIEDYEKSIQVNLLGTIRITKSLLHLVRRARGRIVNLSSIAGCLARAGQSAYSLTKFALEAFSDSLRQEMLKWGVFVILVEPAYFPVGQSILCESNINISLGTVPKNLRDVYGDDYFVDFINTVTDTANSQSAAGTGEPSSTPVTSPSRKQVSQHGSPVSTTSSATSGYSSASSTLKSSLDGEKANPKTDSVTDVKGETFSTLKNRGTPNLSNTNRVLHALVEAVSAPSPKVRYFVGSFQDRMIKSLAPILPTMVMDTYLTSGQMSKVIPKLIKEKIE